MKLNDIIQEQETDLIQLMRQALETLKTEYVKMKLRGNSFNGLPIEKVFENSAAEKFFINTVNDGLNALQKAIAVSEKNPTDIRSIKNRIDSVRQKYFVLTHKHQRPRTYRGETVWYKKYSEHIGKWYAGQFLMQTFDSVIARSVYK